MDTLVAPENGGPPGSLEIPMLVFSGGFAAFQRGGNLGSTVTAVENISGVRSH